MADNGTAQSAPTVAWDDIGPGVAYQRIKLVHGADGVNDGDVSGTNGLPVRPAACATATIARVTASGTASQSLRVSTAGRRGLIVYNDSTADLYLKYGTAATSTSFTYKLPAGAHWEMPSPLYTGAIDGIWSATNGAAQITELA